jgi:uncharacterized cupin superfamily protein
MKINKLAGNCVAVATLMYGSAVFANHDHGDEKGHDHHDNKAAKSRVIHPADTEKLKVGPDMNKVDLYVPNDNGKGVLAAGVEYLKVNSRVPAHIHKHTEELIYIIEGEGEAIVNDGTEKVKAGDLVHVIPGTAHGLTNTSKDTELKFFVVYSGNDMMKFFRDYAFVDLADMRERFNPKFMRNLMIKHNEAFAVPRNVKPLFSAKEVKASGL